jgi:hypothetical protein
MQKYHHVSNRCIDGICFESNYLGKKHRNFYLQIHVCTHMCMRVCECVHTRVYIYTYMRMHTLTHTHALVLIYINIKLESII